MLRAKKILVPLLLTFAALRPALAEGAATGLLANVSQQEENRAVALRVFDEIFNQDKFNVADEIYAKDFVNHGLHRDAYLAEDQAAVRSEKQLFPNLRITVDLMVAEGDLVTVVWTARGTNSGHSGAIPATGLKLELRGITVWRIVGGKIRDEWTSFDELRILRQFVSQLKWQLFGLLLGLILFFLVAGTYIRRLRVMFSSKAAHTTA